MRDEPRGRHPKRLRLAFSFDAGRAGIVCPQGVLFRGQPEVEEETVEFDDDGNPKVKRRKADDEHLIRKALLNARLIDAVISLPLNVFYGAGVPACLLILRKDRPAKRRDKVLLVYAARHYRELSAQNELRPHDVMRILIHYHAYGDATKVADLVTAHGGRILQQIDFREEEEVGRLRAEYQVYADRMIELDAQIAAHRAKRSLASAKADKSAAESVLAKAEKAHEKLAAKLAERDERVAEALRRAQEDREDVTKVGDELVSLHVNPDELLKHARVVGLNEIEENEFNLNIPRYVDTFEPESQVDVKDSLMALANAERSAKMAEKLLTHYLVQIGYEI
jgi:type I restriction enzyme M protein